MIAEISGAMCVVDLEGRVIWASHEFDRWFSRDGKRAIGKTIDSLVPGLYKECPKSVVISHVDYNGLKHFLEARCETTYDDEGKEISSLISFKDVTLLQLLLNISVLTMSTSTPVALLDQAIGAISDTFGYKTIAAMLYKDGFLELAVSRGYSPRLQNLFTRQKVSPEERGLAGRSAYTLKVITKEIKEGTVSPKLLEESRRLDIRWATTIPLTDRDGLLGVLAFSTSTPPATDEIDLLKTVCNQITVSLRKILFEEALVKARNELELYVDLMCHDITNAIQISLGYLELVESDASTTNYGYVSCSMNALHKINRLIGTVRTLRSAPGMMLKDVNLKDAVKSAVTVIKCSRSAEEKGVSIDIDNVSDLTVRANNLLKDVIYNLIDATVRRVRYRGSIWIRTEQKNHDCRLIIEDSGPGMIEMPGTRPHAEVPAVSLHETPSISMYFVFSVVKNYGGTVEIESRVQGELEQGNRVIISLKCA
ncbi:PAS domain-containing protein [Methanocella arvoryzae]|uniref:Predicted signal transduction receptor n=1 Tax=Methanocella arvoryzae (strain DSM 22066 / NBRC 105507 / MRE50) TaxID=351160 RepID=Q0W0S2_METAR|nr:PAS domain-containing protein [Methanocella arvoryzae]CAJ38021.1 predicted signal transduction receptor [Methanocella arvoryzae MRE50]